jgi:hypothetical protein
VGENRGAGAPRSPGLLRLGSLAWEAVAGGNFVTEYSQPAAVRQLCAIARRLQVGNSYNREGGI